MLYTAILERRNALDQEWYRTGQLAGKAAVSERTLRYYDRVGLLSPSSYTEAGYRLYTNEDLLNLQQILALKFLGFSLEEIKALLRTGPRQIQEVLAQQKAMMQEKRRQLDSIIKALDEAEKLVLADGRIWQAIIGMIQAMQMEKKPEWQDKYFTPEQREMMNQLSQSSYSEEAKRKLKQFHSDEWTEEDQKRVDTQYAFLASELKRLVAEGADPASPDAQSAAHLYHELIFGFTQGDSDIKAGLKNWWQNYDKLTEEARPVQMPYSKEEGEFLAKATEIYNQNK